MQEINKYLKFIIPVILISATLYGYLTIKKYDFKITDPSIAISNNNILFIETSDFPNLISELLNDKSIWNELRQIPDINKADSLIKELSALPVNDDQIKLLFTGKVILALKEEPAGDPSLVFISQQLIRRQDKAVYSSLQGMKEINNINRRKYEGVYIYKVEMTKDSGIKPFSFSFKKGLFIWSFSDKQIEETMSAIDNIEKKEPIHRYSRIRATVADNISANIYFNCNSLDRLLNTFTLDSPVNTNLFAASAGFDIEINKSHLSLNGFITVNDTLNNAIEIISGQTPALMKLPEAIPASAIFFMTVNFNSSMAFFNRQSEFELWKPDQNKLDEIQYKYSIGLQKFFQDITTGEFGLVTLEDRNKPLSFFVMEVASGSIAENQLKEWIRKWSTLTGQNTSGLRYYKIIDNQSGIHIYRLPLGGIPEMVFGKAFRNVNADFFTVHQNYLIFGNSAEEVGEYAYHLLLGRNITETGKYKNILENLLSRSSLFIYLEPNTSAGMFTTKMSKQSLEFYTNNKDALNKFNALTLQANYSDDLYYTRVFINYTENFNEHVNTVWQSRLDTVIITKPAIVINHTNAGKEIMVQDANNQLYLISNAGRILWKIPLDGPIISEIFQIDYYRNRRLQYLFNTSNKIYLIDRNGNPVAKYPLSLRSPASNGLSLFDYEGTGNFRICVAGENRQIYMYDREGRTVPGWTPSPTDHVVTKPLQYFRAGQRDYIVAADMYKSYIYDRRGRIRVNPSKQYPLSINNPFYLDQSKGQDKARLVTTDSAGNILYIYLSGNTGIEKREALSNKHFFILTDLNGNNQYEYITTDRNALTVRDEKGNLIFQESFESDISHKPVIFEFARTDRKIGIVIENEDKIYLFNSDGTIYNGFPLKGSSLFSISSFPDLKGRFNLIVGNKDNFLYNYSVQ